MIYKRRESYNIQWKVWVQGLKVYCAPSVERKGYVKMKNILSIAR
jgi:hypothetical protein